MSIPAFLVSSTGKTVFPALLNKQELGRGGENQLSITPPWCSRSFGGVTQEPGACGTFPGQRSQEAEVWPESLISIIDDGRAPQTCARALGCSWIVEDVERVSHSSHVLHGSCGRSEEIPAFQQVQASPFSVLEPTSSIVPHFFLKRDRRHSRFLAGR